MSSTRFQPMCAVCLAAFLLNATFTTNQAQGEVPQLTAPAKQETTDGFDASFNHVISEITASLDDRPALVMWLFDLSQSTSKRRAKSLHRLEQLYAGRKDRHPAYSAIAGFGSQTQLVTPQPLADFEPLELASQQLKDDDSGVENVFAAVQQCLENYQTFIDGNKPVDIFVVIVTDERGDDSDQLEEAIAKCIERRVQVFCLGNAAPFGQTKGHVQFKYPDGFTEWIAVDQGPETAFPHSLTLNIWPPTDSVPLRRVSSGFGPWALTRLCTATEGRYFIVEDTGEHIFTRSRLAGYLPEYQPIEVQQVAVRDSPARQAVIEFSMKFAAAGRSTPRFQFRADSPGVLRSELSEAQKRVAKLPPLVDEALAAFEQALPDRESLKSRRWQAAFDLAYGRLLAHKVRLDGLNRLLAHMKAEPSEFATEEHNTWHLIATEAPIPGPGSVERSGTATRHLNSVLNRRRGTPFAHFAEVELRRGFGWKWIESHRDYKGPPGKVIKPVFIYETNPQTGKRRIVGKL